LQDAKLLSLGGDHSVTWPLIRAHAKKHPKLTILQIDAHPDLYDELDGNRHAHACPFARIMEEGLVDRLVQIGIRTLNKHQREQAARFGVEIIEMKDWSPEKLPVFDSPLYLTLDLDGLDPAYAPGVSHHEPGGFSTREVIRIIQNLPPVLVGADIVELNPVRDPIGITAMLGSKLLREVAAKMLL
jgi:arginase